MIWSSYDRSGDRERGNWRAGSISEEPRCHRSMADGTVVALVGSFAWSQGMVFGVGSIRDLAADKNSARPHMLCRRTGAVHSGNKMVRGWSDRSALR
jgi:hypothetical protein